MSKCCDLFKIHKKTSNCVVTCYHKSFSTASQPVTPMSHSKIGRNYVSSAERNHANARGSAS